MKKKLYYKAETYDTLMMKYLKVLERNAVLEQENEALRKQIEQARDFVKTFMNREAKS